MPTQTISVEFLVIVSLVKLISAQVFTPYTRVNCPANSESYDCNNRCELTCDNIGDEIETANYSIPFGYEGCEKGCWCNTGYIRDDDGNCVLQTNDSCYYDPCADEPNTIWNRCVLPPPGRACYDTSQCKKRKGPPYWKSMCICKPGYSLNLNNECIRATSRACRALTKVKHCWKPKPQTDF